MRKIRTCDVTGHAWRPLPSGAGGRAQKCLRCGAHQLVDWIYLGPGSGVGRVAHAPTAHAAELAGVSVPQRHRD